VGTKGLLLDDGRIVRELDRSFDFAGVHEFPVVLFKDPGGRVLLAHCPGHAYRVELEEAETGRLLTASTDRQPLDVCHSRLAASPHGKRLLSAGWVWHPLSVVVCFDVGQALADPRHLDNGEAIHHSTDPGLAEQSSACWLDDDCLAVAASTEPGQDGVADDTEPRPCRHSLAVYDLTSGTCLRSFEVAEPAGTIMALGKRHVLSLYRHPKLIDLSTGDVVHVWTELHSGLQDGSLISSLEGEAKPPPMVLDSQGKRFAIVNGDTVTVIRVNDVGPSSG